MNTFLKKGTLVLIQDTNENICYKPIESITVGTLILSHWGCWRNVINVESKRVTDSYIIKGKGIIPTFITSDSKLYIKNSTVDTTEWREAKDVTNLNFSAIVIPHLHEFTDINDKIIKINEYLLNELKLSSEKEIDDIHAFINGKYLFRNIESVVKNTTTDTAYYGLEVSEENTYIANGMIVHA